MSNLSENTVGKKNIFIVRGYLWFQKKLRALYDWVLKWADTPYGIPALFLLAFSESSFFPVPPDVLLIALAIAKPKRAFYFALICYVGSILGGILGYGIGAFAMDTIGQPIIKYYHAEKLIAKISYWFHTYGFWGVLIAAITPIPYKVFTITSGSFNLAFSKFMIASLIGRGTRFFAVSALIFIFGIKIKNFIDKYFNLLSVLFVILLILGFIVIKYI